MFLKKRWSLLLLKHRRQTAEFQFVGEFYLKEYATVRRGFFFVFSGAKFGIRWFESFCRLNESIILSAKKSQPQGLQAFGYVERIFSIVYRIRVDLFPVL